MLLSDTLGRLDEAGLRRVLELFNQDVSQGREVQGRFATGLVGRNANLLVESLANVNEIVPRLWRADDAWLTANLVALRRSGRLPGGGWLFLSMVLHARAPRRFVPYSTTMAQGLAALEGRPRLALRTGADYLEYCRRVHALLAAHGIDPYGADVLLVNGSRLARAALDDDDDETEAEASAVPATAPAAAPLAAPQAPVAAAPAVEVRAPQPATSANTGSIGWLHLTDLHQGMSGTSWLWPNVKAQLFADLERLHAHSGPWDVVFFTGDLTQRGSQDEFDQLDRTLDQLWARLEKLGSRPQLVAVPGNHDLERPGDRFDPVVLALRQWHDDRRLRDHVLAMADNQYTATLRRAFAAYDRWSSRRCASGGTRGLLPGDTAVTVRAGGLSLGVIGLNSAFLQLADGDYLERLDVDPRQLHEVCGHDAPEWLGQHDFNFLLTHHPPAWLAPRARKEFMAEVDVAGRFAAHLYGHMHEGASLATSHGGAPMRLALQGSSLFGLEEYVASDGRRLQRLHGYSAGRFERVGATGRLQIFPRRMLEGPLGRRIERDLENYALDDRGAITHTVVPSRPR